MDGKVAKSKYLDELNEIQRQAVTAGSGPVMVIAGPGSGKTRVLTYRIAHLIQQGVPPHKILALTFTNKAAKEMKARIEKVIGPVANRVLAGTFHSIFARFLRYDAHLIGYPNDFTIYDTDDTKSVVKEIIKKMSLDPKVYQPNIIRSRISMAKSNLITPKLYGSNEDLLSQDRINRRPMTQMIYGKYMEQLMRSGAMDFDDLLLQMFRLLYENHDNVKEKYQNKFEYVLVDEFQDTNFLQYQIIRQLVVYDGSPNNVNIVGDDAQSIYSFRGATIENILKFEADFPKVQTFKLEQNYRSTSYIVNAANDVISFNKKQIQKKIWTDIDEGEKIKVERCLTDTEEGRKVASLITEQRNRYHLKYNDIAILYRTNAQSRVFEEHLRRHNIPYRIYGGLSFYSRKEIKDVVAYLRLTVNYRDNEAFKRIINYPKRGLGNTTIGKITKYADDNQISMWEAIGMVPLSGRAKNTLLNFGMMIKDFQERAKTQDAYTIASYIVKKSGILDLLKVDNTPEGISRVENVSSLLDGIKEFIDTDEIQEGQTLEMVDNKSLATYLQNIALITDQDETDPSLEHVTLMSVHAAKGLEFPSVFVVGLEENLFPSYLSQGDPAQLDEERRLFYVAITRAEKYLTLTCAGSRYHYGQVRNNDMSRFMEEIGGDNVDSVISVGNTTASFGSARATRASISGNFKKLAPIKKVDIGIDPSDFKASPSSAIEEGMKVLHLKFGEGEVISIDGARDNRVASIRFDQMDNSERRIMLRFAKLQILDS